MSTSTTDAPQSISIASNSTTSATSTSTGSSTAKTTEEKTESDSSSSSGPDVEQHKHIVDQDAVKALCQTLQCEDPKLLLVTLEGIENLLREMKSTSSDSEQSISIMMLMEEAGGLCGLELLQSHESEEVRSKAQLILRTYFPAEEIEA
eukprot:TRINITY_DN10276_c0_g1_i1.p2 TRINITY_DN10276_c0_g1~~TRINITY_DN10276_c0_g1_i1.p2  ORF type:complete len:149 (+),score=41.34 TRINITY_DN10276_c0_g1_i1:83-529(+)